MNKLKNHTRNQRRMYRIHKLEEKIQAQELMIGSLKEQLEASEKARKEAIKILKECLQLLPHEFDWQEQAENIINKLDIDKGE